VADALHHGGLGTLLFDLLTVEEDRRHANVFDIELLAGRLTAATTWLRAQRVAEGASIGYFGASTGAAAALWAAAGDPGIGAVVSRGGRPDLAAGQLHDVRAPTLLVVGGLDPVVLQLNRRALALMPFERRLEVVDGATHLFEEPGTLDSVASMARRWFADHLSWR
jgi:putative phosphoribosyl transferase